MHLDRQGIAVAILGVAGGDAHPAFTDAIFLDIGLLDTFEADADVARQDLLIVKGTARVDRKPVRQFVVLGSVLVVHSNASISFFNPCGAVVGAWRAITLPERSTRNLVKFHLIDEPSRPDFSVLR